MAALCWGITLVLANISTAQLIRTVALQGQAAPGLSTGEKFLYFGRPVINSAGQTAFTSSLYTSDVGSYRNGIWSEGSGSLTMVIGEGDQVPAAPPGTTLSFFYGLALNNDGRVLFGSNISGLGTNNENDVGIWSDIGGVLGLVWRASDPAPGAPNGVNYSASFRMPNFTINSGGALSIVCDLDGVGVNSSNSRGVFTGRPGSMTMLARSDDPAPGTPSGIRFDLILVQAMVNSATQMGFYSGLTGSGINTSNNSGIWFGTPGSLALVARDGDPAASAPAGAKYVSPERVTINSNGRVAFTARLTGGGVTALDDSGIWSGPPGSLVLAVREGASAVGTESGVTYSGFGQELFINVADEIVFRGNLRGGSVNSTNNTGIWSQALGGLHLVAREGSQAPGTPTGVSFGAGSNNLVLNAAGQVAFFSDLAGPGVDSTNDIGIWAEDRTGQLQLIARVGDVLDVGPNDSRTITELAFGSYSNEFTNGSGNEGGLRSGFNDLGQLVFFAAFADGSSGIFVSSKSAVPEPNAFFLATVAAMGLLLRRRTFR